MRYKLLALKAVFLTLNPLSQMLYLCLVLNWPLSLFTQSIKNMLCQQCLCDKMGLSQGCKMVHWLHILKSRLGWHLGACFWVAHHLCVVKKRKGVGQSRGQRWPFADKDRNKLHGSVYKAPNSHYWGRMGKARGKQGMMDEDLWELLSADLCFLIWVMWTNLSLYGIKAL